MSLMTVTNGRTAKPPQNVHTTEQSVVILPIEESGSPPIHTAGIAMGDQGRKPISIGLIAIASGILFAVVIAIIYFSRAYGSGLPEPIGSILIGASLVGELLSAVAFMWGLIIRSF